MKLDYFVTKYHNAIHGCPKCNQRGITYKNRVVYSKISGSLRTDASFTARSDINHHRDSYKNKKSILEDCGFKLVSQFPLDPMHLVDLGVAKKLLTLICTMYKKRVPEMSVLIENISKNFIPHEFNRKPRNLDELPRFKAT